MPNQTSDPATDRSDRIVVSYTVKPDSVVEVPNPPRVIQGALPRFPGVDLPIPFLLPLIMAVTQFFSSKMMTMPSRTRSSSDEPHDDRDDAGHDALLGITFPAGLVLYWLVSNLFEMVRLYFTMGPQSLSWAAGGGQAASVAPGAES